MRLPAPAAFRLALLLLAAPLLGGCLMFERPPAPLVCDRDLVGRWMPLPGTNTAGSSLGRDDYVQIDAQCTATLVDDKNMKDRPTFPARGFSLDGQRYLAFNQAAMRQLFSDDKMKSPPSSLPAESVMLVKYRIVNGVLEVAVPDASVVAELSTSKIIQGREVDSLYYVVEGDAKALRGVLADHPELFETFDEAGRPLRLRRASTGAAP